MKPMTFARLVKIMRVLCPLAVALGVAGVVSSFYTSSYYLMAFNAVIAIVNAGLSWVQWRVLDPVHGRRPK